MKKIWTFDNIVNAYHQVRGMSREQARRAGLEKQWWAVYRHNKSLLIKDKTRIYTLSEIASNRDLRQYVMSVITQDLFKGRKNKNRGINKGRN